MRFLVLVGDRHPFQEAMLDRVDEFEGVSYEELLQIRRGMWSGPGTSYALHLAKLGHEVHDVYPTNAILQAAWARDHGGRSRDWRRRLHLGIERAVWRLKDGPLERVRRSIAPRLPWRRGFAPWLHEALDRQIRTYRPDVIWTDTWGPLLMGLLRGARTHFRMLTAYVGLPVASADDLAGVDLALAPAEGIVESIRALGVRCELARHAVPDGLMAAGPEMARDLPLSFVGALSPSHHTRMELLTALSEAFDLKVWGHGVEYLPADSSLRRCWMGTVWGRGAYDILRRSRVTINCHIDGIGSDVGNMRLFEATGARACLVTDWKPNLQRIFEPDQEVAAYRSAAECREWVGRLLGDEQERARIAEAGAQRAFSQHTYRHRAEEFVAVLRRYL
ncbi:MAG: glycosyltransferase [Nitrospirae bacterium]|nr:glycosyltransferase [Nitrospirota bacterium]